MCLAISVGVLAIFICSGKEVLDFNHFGNSFTESLCSRLQQQTDEHCCQEEPISQEKVTKEDEEVNDAVVQTSSKPAPSRVSYLASKGNYDPKKAMAKRRKHLVKVCQKYADIMTPESIMRTKEPPQDNYFFYPKTKMAFCGMPGVAQNRMKRLSQIEMNDELNKEMVKFQIGFPKSLKTTKKVILVRHPLERLVSAYRNEFEAHLDAKTGQQMPAELSFSYFLEIVTDGYLELAKYFDDNNLDGESVALNTGMVDGKGKSKAWQTYWNLCAVCNPIARPDYIMHMDTLNEDMKVIVDAMDNREKTERFTNSKIVPQASNPEVLKHYYSQVPKSQIEQLAIKYKHDMELFGFDAQYFINMGAD